MNVNYFIAVLTLSIIGMLIPVISKLIKLPKLTNILISSVAYVVSGFLILTPLHGKILPEMFQSDGVAELIGIFIIIASWMVSLTIGFIKREDRFVNEILATILISTSGALCLISSINLISMFISMEFMTIPTYLLVVSVKSDHNIEASTKYFFNGALASASVLFGISLIYGMTGSFNFLLISLNLFKDPLNLVAVAFILTGFGFELTIFPFHFWGPDVYDGAYPAVSAFLTGVSKSAAVIALLRLVFEALPIFRDKLSIVFAILAILTMTTGNILALAQKRITRILAYSSMAHAGYILVGFAALSVPLSITGIIYHDASYIFMKTGAFLSAAVFLYIYGARTKDDYRGLGKKEPLFTALFALFLFSLSGVPPTAGFTGKLFLFTSAVNAGMGWLALIGLLNSAFSVGYYLWIVKQMYFEKPSSEEPLEKNSRFLLTPLMVLAILVVVFGIWVNPITYVSGHFASMVGFRP